MAFFKPVDGVSTYHASDINQALNVLDGTDTTTALVLAGPLTLSGAVTISSPVTYQKGFNHSRQVVTYAATVTPDPVPGEIYQVALTGNITVNAPTTPIAGQFLTFEWAQDATGGRVVTYNGIFKTGGATAFLTTLSTITIDRFYYSGSAWRIMSRITGQAI